MFLLFKRIEPDTEPKVFIEMLLKPVEFLIILIVTYLSINQLDYPLNEVIFRRTSLIDNVPTLYELKVVQVVDKLILLLFWNI
jgi:MscS family membrane protein